MELSFESFKQGLEQGWEQVPDDQRAAVERSAEALARFVRDNGVQPDEGVTTGALLGLANLALILFAYDGPFIPTEPLLDLVGNLSFAWLSVSRNGLTPEQREVLDGLDFKPESE